MSETLNIRVSNSKLEIDEEVTVHLPIIIGREGKLKLDPDDLRYSRQHAILGNFQEGLVLEDRSANGTWVENEKRLLKGEHVTLAPSDTFSIFDYRFTVGDPIAETEPDDDAPYLVFWRNAPRDEPDHIHIEPGHQAEIHLHETHVDLQPGRQIGTDNRIPEVDLVISNNNGGLTLHIREQSDGYQVYRNNRALTESSSPLTFLDVIIAVGHRLEIVSQDSEVLICGNYDCQLLNAHEPEAQCRFCGRDLVHGGTLFGTSLLARR